MTTIDHKQIRRLAEQCARAERHLKALSGANVPCEIDKQIAQDAEYQLALSACVAAARAYHEAINRLSPEELIALSQGAPAGEPMS